MSRALVWRATLSCVHRSGVQRVSVGVAAEHRKSLTASVSTRGSSLQKTWRWGGGLMKESSMRGMCTDAKTEEAPKDLKREVLNAALKHVSRWGWSVESIAEGAKDLGLSPMSHGLYPRGGIEIVEHLHDQMHEEWLAELRSAKTENLSSIDKLLYACKLRLLKQGAYVSSWPQALALQALPLNAPAAIANVARTSDRAWVFAGDTATDGSWYSKRMMVGAVYMAAEVYMLTDYSVDYEDTCSFMERQFRDAQGTAAYVTLAFKQVEVLMQQALQSMKESRPK